MGCEVRTGSLNKRVIIQQVAETQTKGKVSLTASDVATVWASIKPLSHDEKVKHQQVQDKTTHEVRLRYFAGLDGSYRFLHNSRIFNIASIIDVNEQHREHLCLCVEG